MIDLTERVVSALENISKQITNSNNSDYQLTIISIIINVILVGVVFSQLWIYRNEINMRMRPWIGATEGFETAQDMTLGIEFHYSNFGSAPANFVRERWGASDKIPTRSDIKNDFTHVFDLSTTLPTQKKQFSFTLNRDLYDSFRNNGTPLYFWAFIDYKYGRNKVGEYGMVVEFKIIETSSRLFVKDEWAV